MMTSGDRRRQAVALAYQEGEQAPRVVAKGYGELAERIMAEAQRQGIYVHDAPELVALLMQRIAFVAQHTRRVIELIAARYEALELLLRALYFGLRLALSLLALCHRKRGTASVVI